MAETTIEGATFIDKNAIPEEPKPKKSLLRKNWSLLLFGVMVAIIVVGIATYVTQPAQPQPKNIYAYMQNNFNSTLATYQGLTNITTINSTIQLLGNPARNLSNETVIFPQSNRTTIYFFGVEASAQSAVETYVLWNYLTKHTFPSYSSTQTVSQASVPMIPEQVLLGNITSSNPVLTELMVPLTYQQWATQSNLTSDTFIDHWLAYNLSIPEAYLFADINKGSMPSIDVVKTIGNKTIVCNGFSPFSFVLYNATSSTKFLGLNTAGQDFGELLPTPSSINVNLNVLSSCVEAVNRWSG